MKTEDMLDFVAWVLAMAGGVNWGLVGLFKLNLIEAILGPGFLGRLAYILIGAGAGYLIWVKYKKKSPA